jgi:AcrR family transcriptional regulator
MTVPAVPIRQKTRQVVRSLIASSAFELFAARGYDETTLDEVAAAAGVSRRTLFNYFRSKEELALSGLSEQGEHIAARFAERPEGEDIWASLRAAFEVLYEVDTTPEQRFAFVKLLFENESLRSGHAEKQARWQDLLAPLIEARLPASPQQALAARAIAATGIVCLQTAMTELARLDGNGDAFALYDAAINAVTGHRPA